MRQVYRSAQVTTRSSFDSGGFDARTDGGKAALAVFLTAKNTGTQVTVYGLGTCSIYPTNVEDLNYVVNL